MSIRRRLLLMFLLMGLAPAATITGLAFFQARNALTLEIIRNLGNEASTKMVQIERMIYERVLHVHTWSELEIMQEVRVGDVDKRLSHLLFDLHRHYNGVYKALYCSNPQQVIVAASDPALVGRTVDKHEPWLTIPLAFGETRLSPLLPGRESNSPSIEMSAIIHDTQKQGEVGTLNVMFDWDEISRLLDVPGNAGTQGTGSLAVLFDSQGRIIAASALLRERGLLLSGALASWQKGITNGAVIDDTEGRLGVGEVLAGAANAQGYQSFQRSGWTVQIYQPTAQAFAPIDRMATAFFLLLGLTSAAAVALSMLSADGIARPIQQLTELTRRFMRKQPLGLPVAYGKGEVGQLTESFLRMIADLEVSRENLVRASKLAVVGEMAAAMAHEVRTPLGIMRSSAQMLQREPVLSETGKEMLGFMLSETDRLNQLIASLLDCARPRAPNFHSLHLHPIAQRVLDLLSVQAQKKHLQLIGEFAAVEDELRCDEDQILQVLLNLVMNAVQILPDGGKVTLRTESSRSALTLNIDDDGPGIAEAERGKVFDPFYTQREGGIGLGLTVVQQIIRAHGADIVAMKSPEGGARFQIVFPIAPPPTQKQTPL